ncbi:unnamed protein product [Parnassius apollo]|uniref:(apollo) hypothetical protein n=1 Tax=Parnassius apollo TaxID=110799 RepID=A0A8S3X7Q4_PARAO|nr:unnamed protein product [Parnassius apollo]
MSLLWVYFLDKKVNMPRRKKPVNREDMLRKKRLAEQKRRNKIKSNPELYKEYLEKEKARYIKRKDTKKIVPIKELKPREQRAQRKKWKINQQNLRRKKKELKMLQEKYTPPESDSEDFLERNFELQQEHQDAIKKASTFARLVTENYASHDPWINPRPGPSDQSELIIGNKTPDNRRPVTKNCTSNSAQPICHTPKDSPSSATRRVRYRMLKKCKYYQKRLSELEKQNAAFRKRVFRMRQTITKLKSCNSPGTKAGMIMADPTKKEDVKKAIIFGDILKSNINLDYENQKKAEKQKLKENIEPVREKLKNYNLL